ncbi:MAG: MerR family transcriptional regulator [Actinomycetaceae bacterium]
MRAQEWSMQEIVKVSGATSRSIRHYESTGLLAPSRTGHGGLRYFDQAGLLRLQRILVLRELGLGLREIRPVLDGEVPEREALLRHVADLEDQRARLATMAASVRSTIEMIDHGGELMPETMFDGFDHTQHKDEVVQRWGAESYRRSNAWWTALSDDDRQAFREELDALVAAFADAAARGVDPDGEEADALGRRQYEWVRAGWGGSAPSAEAFTGLGQMYVDDPRFGATYTRDGVAFATFVRDVMAAYAARNLA